MVDGKKIVFFHFIIGFFFFGNHNSNVIDDIIVNVFDGIVGNGNDKSDDKYKEKTVLELAIEYSDGK